MGALRTPDHEAKLRRLQQIQYDKLDRADSTANDLAKLAIAETTQLRTRLSNSDDIVSMKVNQICKLDKGSRGRANKDPRTGDYKWIMRANDEEDRAARRAIRDQTELAIASGGYTIGLKSKVPLQYVDALIEGARLVSPSFGDWPVEESADPAPPDAASTTKLIYEKAVVLEVATREVLNGKNVVVVSAASAYHTGGGFASGGRHALEESMCVQSTLYPSLQKATQLAENVGVRPQEWIRPAQNRSGGEWMMHIPDDGAVLSPLVEVFRGGTLEGYPFQEAAVALEAVISVAMPNKNDRMADSPVDSHPEPGEYQAQLRRKWRAVLTAAAKYTNADTLVIPDAGCGVFRNAANEVGVAFGQVFRLEFANRFKEIFIAYLGGGESPDGFAESAMAASKTPMGWELDT